MTIGGDNADLLTDCTLAAFQASAVMVRRNIAAFAVGPIAAPASAALAVAERAW